jgi:curved DNA-binding protein CbpA
MPKIRTHYDTLKVSRDAPIEVIQAAYRSLARKYHPDKTGGTPEAMKSINAAYEVLSDPAQRAQHDRWIAAQQNRVGGGAWDDQADDTASPDDPGGRRGRTASPSLTTIALALCYGAVALSLLRIPGYRFVGIAMLLAGWMMFNRWRR